MRVAVVDIGTNSTRLLIADVAGSALTEVDRRSTVTRLGAGVERTGELSAEGIARVNAALDEYAQAIGAHGADRRVGVLTSAVRDAANGPAFTEQVRDAYGIDARTIPGDEEARLSFLGATSARDPRDPTPLVVLDIGGGSTEFIVGAAGAVSFHVSTQIGVVRLSERHIHTDPPQAGELDALRADAGAGFAAAVPQDVRTGPRRMIAVAGTATSMATIDQALEPYDSARVDGYEVTLAACEAIGERLAAVPEDERRRTPGLHPDRAPTIVAGTILITEAMRLFALDRASVSERDILHGVALATEPG
jgi:exopolyphosphatase/guanosine-5'-triphosphate,3'-diphosphate pyrophosphatase